MSPANKQEERFATLLLRAIDRIAFLQDKKRELVREQLGQDIGRTSSTIDFWIYRKRLPARVEDLERLVRQIAALGGWKDEEDCLLFLQNARHPAPDALLQQVFAQSLVSSAHSIENAQPSPKSMPPFVVGNPVQNPTQFFGRERERRRIFKALQGPDKQNI